MIFAAEPLRISKVDQDPALNLCLYMSCRAVHGGPQHLHRGAADDHRRRLRSMGRALREGQHPRVRGSLRVRLHLRCRRHLHAAQAVQDQFPVRLHGRRSLIITLAGHGNNYSAGGHLLGIMHNPLISG